MMDVICCLLVLVVDVGEKFLVILVIFKYYVIECGCMVVNDGMDVIGGKGICMGLGNFLVCVYQQVFIVIMVEGVNILMCCFIIFGQGVICCYFYVLQELVVVVDEDCECVVQEFDCLFFGYFFFVVVNVVCSFVGGISWGWLLFLFSYVVCVMWGYFWVVVYLLLVFVLFIDVSMGVLGGMFKFCECILVWLGDVVLQFYLVLVVLKWFEDEGWQEEDLFFVDWLVQDVLYCVQEVIIDVLYNFFNLFVVVLLWVLIFLLGLLYCKFFDVFGMCVVQVMQILGESCNCLVVGVYLLCEGDLLVCGEKVFVFVLVVQ